MARILEEFGVIRTVTIHMNYGQAHPGLSYLRQELPAVKTAGAPSGKRLSCHAGGIASRICILSDRQQIKAAPRHHCWLWYYVGSLARRPVGNDRFLSPDLPAMLLR